MNINCAHIQLQEQLFKKNDNVESQKQADMPVTISVQFCPNDDDTKKDAKLEFSLEIGTDKLYEENQLFWFKTKIAGIFAWDEGSMMDAKPHVVREGAEVLTSFARTYFYDTLNRADIEPFVFPVIDPNIFVELNEED